jgi:hypothetical protein
MNIKNLFLGIAIFILTISVGIYGISTLYHGQPKYETYCPTKQAYTEQQCFEINGTWIKYPEQRSNEKPIPVDQNGYCDTYSICQPEFEKAQEKYARKVFLTALPLGIVIIAIGALIFGLVSVGGGLMAGGVGIILYGVGDFWGFAQDWLKFVLSLIGLIIVIILAYYANKKWFSKDKKK